MKTSLPLLAATMLVLPGTASAFLTVQKRDRPATFGTTAASTSSTTGGVPNHGSSSHKQAQPDHVRPLPTFLNSQAGSSSVNPFAGAQDQGFTAWYHDADDSVVDLSYSTIIMACALSMALGFGLGYGT